MSGVQITGANRRPAETGDIALENWQDIVLRASELEASDVFFKPGSAPYLRARGVVGPMEGLEEVTPDYTAQLAESLMIERDWARFQDYHEKDIGLTLEDVCRLRINVYQERGDIGIAIRLIPIEVPTIDELDLPGVLKDIAMRPQGLVLVTGPTGCGKSTTLATMLQHINQNRRTHVVTIEDPIEYVYEDHYSIFSQREVGIDTESFQDALKYIMRQSPDIILIGEMRDIETFNVAMQAAETGHLVFSTVHTCSAAETIERIIHMFPPDLRDQICMRMSQSMVAVLSQVLVPREDAAGRTAAMEIMIVTPTIQQFIENGQTSDIYDAIWEGEHWQMQTMNQALLNFYKQGVISADTAVFYAGLGTEMRQMLRRLDKEQEDARRAAEQKKRATPKSPTSAEPSPPVPAPPRNPGQ